MGFQILINKQLNVLISTRFIHMTQHLGKNMEKDTFYMHIQESSHFDNTRVVLATLHLVKIHMCARIC